MKEREKALIDNRVGHGKPFVCYFSWIRFVFRKNEKSEDSSDKKNERASLLDEVSINYFSR